MKRLLIVVLIMALTIVSTGCTSSERAFLEAYKKTMNINSMESQMTFNASLKGEGFSQEQQLVVDEISNLLSNIQISMAQRMTQNQDKTASKAYVEMNMNVGGLIVPMSVWVDVNMASDSPKLVEYIKMPQMLMSTIYPEKPALQYIVYDFNKIIGEQMNFNELMKFSKEVQPKVEKVIDSYMNNFDPGVEVIKSKGKRNVGGESLSIYEVKLDDASFKKLLTSTVNYSLDDEEMINFIKDYMKFVVNVATAAQEGQISQEEVANEIDNLDKQLPQAKAKFNELMDSIKDVKIIGDDGIVIEYGINKDGYIVYEAGTIDFRLDLDALNKLGNANTTTAEPVKGVLNLKLNYSSNTKNINKNVEITMPEVNEQNSIDFMDFMNMTSSYSSVGVIGSSDGSTSVYIESTLNK